MYGHVRKLAEAEKAGIEKAGGTADIFQYGLFPALFCLSMLLITNLGSLRLSPRRF